MKKAIVKAILAATMLVSVAIGSVEPTNAAAATTPAPAAGKTTTPVPVMTDNLSKYGLKKDLELPVTVTAGGLSYTLHKVMIYDFNSKDAKDLRKKYNYLDSMGMVPNPKYFIWTKITITNKSQKLIQKNFKSISSKWRLFFDSGMNDGEAYMPMPVASKFENNSKKALNDFTLNPGESLTTYQAVYYQGAFKYFEIFLNYNNQLKSQYVVGNSGSN